jgi:hypothetical protein
MSTSPVFTATASPGLAAFQLSLRWRDCTGSASFCSLVPLKHLIQPLIDLTHSKELVKSMESASASRVPDYPSAGRIGTQTVGEGPPIQVSVCAFGKGNLPSIFKLC